MSGEARHLYVHLPFCAHRCGYCDFVTVSGRSGDHGAYVDALLVELELERASLARPVETVFLGGGTPTFARPNALACLLDALPRAAEVTVEANPETVTPKVARLLREAGVTRISLGAQSFVPRLLAVLERRGSPEDVRRAFYHVRDAGFDNISLDLLYGIPGQSSADLRTDLDQVLALAPEHVSYYELEAKPGTRFTHAHGAALAWQAEAMEDYLEMVVDTLERAGYRWYETSSFCRLGELDGSGRCRDWRSRHNLGYWRGNDYVGIGIGAVSTVRGLRWRNGARLRAYVAALQQGDPPAREFEPLDAATRTRERLMLGLRLDEPLVSEEVEGAVDREALGRLTELGLVEQRADRRLRLTRRGRFLGAAVTAELLVETPANGRVPAEASATIGSWAANLPN